MSNDLINVFGGSGFIGSEFCNKYPNCIIQDRNDRRPKTNNLLYFISTVDNYNVFENTLLDVETNLKILCEVLEYCKEGNFTINFISSWFVYGDTDMPANENSICYPKGFYSITKKAAEDLLISFCKTFKQNYRILRLCNAIGTGDKKASKKKNAIGYMINLLKENEMVSLYDGGTPTRDILHVSDICRAVDLICKKGKVNEIYNIGRGKSTEIGYIVKKAKQLLNSKSEIKYINATEFHKIVQVQNFAMNTFKIKELGFVPNLSIDEIINELCL